MTFKWNGGTLITGSTDVKIPEGYTEVRPGVHKPNCAECLFRAFSTGGKGANPFVQLHCKKFKKDVTVAECQQCEESTVDTSREREIKPYIIAQPGVDIETIESIKAKANIWDDCKHRKREKNTEGCGSCTRRVCMNPDAETYRTEISRDICSNCKVREE